jgi:hypothetical protein
MDQKYKNMRNAIIAAEKDAIAPRFVQIPLEILTVYPPEIRNSPQARIKDLEINGPKVIINNHPLFVILLRDGKESCLCFPDPEIEIRRTKGDEQTNFFGHPAPTMDNIFEGSVSADGFIYYICVTQGGTGRELYRIGITQSEADIIRKTMKGLGVELDDYFN